MKLHRFNEAGIAAFEQFLDQCTVVPMSVRPAGLLNDVALSDLVDPTVAIELKNGPFASRFELGAYLYGVFGEYRHKPSLSDKGLWAWLACFMFESVCPRRDGKFIPGARARWVPRSTDYKRYYRHLVAGPFGIYRAHRDSPDRAMAVLCQPIGKPGDVVEQLVSRQEIVSSAGIMGAATALFVDGSTHKQRRGAGGKGAGSARRLVSVLNQLDLTWDLASMSSVELLNRLPKEFRR